MQLVLASASPARLATLRSAGIDPTVIVSGVDESQLDGLPPAELALQLAELKCAAVAERDDVPAGALVLGCDSVLELGGEALGKPDVTRRRRSTLARMRGHSGVLQTGHCLRDTATGRVAAATASTIVHFADLSDAEIAAYVATGEPLHVAGAFTVDGLGGAFVTRHRGRPPQRGRRQPAAAARPGGRARARVDRPVAAGQGLTATTGQAASMMTRWATLPMISLPTGLRCRMPITMASASTSRGDRQDLVGDVAAHGLAQLVLDAALGEPLLERHHALGAEVALVDERVAPGAVDDHHAGLAPLRLLEAGGRAPPRRTRRG